jgi:hypothetical protein
MEETNLPRRRRGSIIITVAFLTAVMALLTASVLGFSLSERRGNERNRLELRAQNVAENVSLYAAEQLTTKLYRSGSVPTGHFPWSGNSTSVVHLPPNSVLLSEFNADAGSTQTILFTDRVTAADFVIADQTYKALTRFASGVNPMLTPANGDVMFTHTDGSGSTSLKNASNLWRDCRWLTTSNPPTASQLANFKTWSTTNYNGNLRAGVHGVTKLVLPGIGDYKEANDPAMPEVDRNHGRQVIESPDHKRRNGSTFSWTTEAAALKQIRISWRAGLYIMVNPDDTARQGKLPNGTVVTLIPRPYRCWLNKINLDGSHTVTEVVLPGQPSYGQGPGLDGAYNTADDIMHQNNLPNQFTNTTSVGVNQILRIPRAGNAWDAVSGRASKVDPTLPISTSGYAIGGSLPTFPANGSTTPYVADAYFHDLRRAHGSGAMGTAGSAADFGRASLTFTPRPIAKIDFDLDRLKMMVARVATSATTSTGYKLDLPTAAGTGWGNGSATNLKLAAVNTEVSTALVVGIVPSHHNPVGLPAFPPMSGVSGGGVAVSAGTLARNGNNVNSGGANNFPRLLDNWSGISLYIRGSLCGLFESRVAMEPFTHSRCYRAPGRFWGPHHSVSQANHDVRLEPIMLNATRLGFRQLNASLYDARKNGIESLTAIP